MKSLYFIVLLGFLTSCGIVGEVQQERKALRITKRWLTTDTSCGEAITSYELNTYDEKKYKSYYVKTTDSVVYVTVATPVTPTHTTWRVSLVVDVKTKQVRCDTLPDGRVSR